MGKPAQVHALLLPAACLLLVLSAGSAVAQDVYKWTDASGTVHYGQQPPPQGAAKVTLRGGVATTQAPPATPASTNDPHALEQANAAQRKHFCDTAKRNLDLVNSKAMIVGAGGIESAKQLSDEDRAKARTEAQAQMAEYCHD